MSKKRGKSTKVASWNFLVAKDRIRKAKPLVYKQYEKELVEIANVTRALFENAILKDMYTKLAKQFFEQIKGTRTLEQAGEIINEFLTLANETSKSSALFEIDEQIKDVEKQVTSMTDEGKTQEEIDAYVEEHLTAPLQKVYEDLESDGLVEDGILADAEKILQEIEDEENQAEGEIDNGNTDESVSLR